MDETTYSEIMSSFKGFADGTKELHEGEGVDQFCIVIKSQVQFSLAAEYLRVGVSFLQTDWTMISLKEPTGLAAIYTCSDLTIAKYDRYACTINLQKILELVGFRLDVCSCSGHINSHEHVLY